MNYWLRSFPESMLTLFRLRVMMRICQRATASSLSSNFEASDEAIANMNGQYLMNKEISVQYAYKKDGKGERHGDQAERMLAAQARKHNVQPQGQQLLRGCSTRQHQLRRQL
jgi:hypothetical protein